jgi:hypothetical protein
MSGSGSSRSSVPPPPPPNRELHLQQYQPEQQQQAQQQLHLQDPLQAPQGQTQFSYLGMGGGFPHYQQQQQQQQPYDRSFGGVSQHHQPQQRDALNPAPLVAEPPELSQFWARQRTFFESLGSGGDDGNDDEDDGEDDGLEGERDGDSSGVGGKRRQRPVRRRKLSDRSSLVSNVARRRVLLILRQNMDTGHRQFGDTTADVIAHAVELFILELGARAELQRQRRSASGPVLDSRKITLSDVSEATRAAPHLDFLRHGDGLIFVDDQDETGGTPGDAPLFAGAEMPPPGPIGQTGHHNALVLAQHPAGGPGTLALQGQQHSHVGVGQHFQSASASGSASSSASASGSVSSSGPTGPPGDIPLLPVLATPVPAQPPETSLVFVAPDGTQHYAVPGVNLFRVSSGGAPRTSAAPVQPMTPVANNSGGGAAETPQTPGLWMAGGPHTAGFSPFSFSPGLTPFRNHP